MQKLRNIYNSAILANKYYQKEDVASNNSPQKEEEEQKDMSKRKEGK